MIWGWSDCRLGIRVLALPVEESFSEALSDRAGGVKRALADAADRVDVASGGGEKDFGDWSFGQIGQGNGVLEDGNG